MKKINKTSSYGLYKTRYYNRSNLFLLGKRNLVFISSEISYEKFLLHRNNFFPLLSVTFQTSPFNKCLTQNQQNQISIDDAY